MTTVIVLLILAGVTVATLTGENGLLSKAKLAKERTAEAEQDEKRKLNEMASQLAGNSREENDDLKTQVLNMVYPIGSIYIGTTNVNPSTFIGGTWEVYAEGRTLIGAGTGTDENNEAKTFAANDTGGEYEHQLSIAEMPNHTHTPLGGGSFIALGGTANQAGTNGFTNSSSSGWWRGSNKGDTTLATNGEDEPHNNVQPYIVTYMWKRTN